MCACAKLRRRRSHRRLVLPALSPTQSENSAEAVWQLGKGGTLSRGMLHTHTQLARLRMAFEPAHDLKILEFQRPPPTPLAWFHPHKVLIRPYQGLTCWGCLYSTVCGCGRIPFCDTEVGCPSSSGKMTKIPESDIWKTLLQGPSSWVSSFTARL